MNDKSSRLPVYIKNGPSYAYNLPLTRKFGSTELTSVETGFESLNLNDRGNCSTSSSCLSLPSSPYKNNAWNPTIMKNSSSSPGSNKMLYSSRIPSSSHPSYHSSPREHTTQIVHPVDSSMEQPLNIDRLTHCSCKRSGGGCRPGSGSTLSFSKYFASKANRDVHFDIDYMTRKSCQSTPLRSKSKYASTSKSTPTTYESNNLSRSSTLASILSDNNNSNHSCSCQCRGRSPEKDQFSLAQLQGTLKKGDYIEGMLRIQTRCGQDFFNKTPRSLATRGQNFGSNRSLPKHLSVENNSSEILPA
ncbi:uncharacterized protein LOC141854995 [Brevipalpus obovatus]|uniref:uncharacterized protein LOC141854995 n=1 Tax=Brevipalpus obovatus TaxID=246614 RepID=UPI003D9E6B9B